MKTENQTELMKKTSFKIFGYHYDKYEFVLFQTNYVKKWNEVKIAILRLEKLQLKLLGRIFR